MPLPNHVAFRVELAEIIAHAATLHVRIRQFQADHETYQQLTDYPIPEDLAVEYAEKHQYFEGELNSILDILVSKYQETPLSTLECFYFPGDAEDVENYGQELMDWTSDIRKNLIQLKTDTAKMLRDKETESEIPKDWLLSEFLTYEQRLKNIYHSVVRFEYWLKIKYKPAPLPNPRQDLVPSSPSAQVIPDTGSTNDGVSLTERLDKIRNTISTFQASRPEFSSRLCEIHQKYQLESLRSSFSSQYSSTIFQAVNSIISECLPHLLSAARSEYQQVLADNEQAFHDYLERKLNSSLGLIQVVLGVTNAALMSEPEEGELIE